MIPERLPMIRNGARQNSRKSARRAFPRPVRVIPAMQLQECIPITVIDTVIIMHSFNYILHFTEYCNSITQVTCPTSPNYFITSHPQRLL